MASSRRPGRADPGPVEALEAALAPLGASARAAVAFSGGLDSTVLLHAAAQVLPAGRLLALHVDHGLQAASAEWAIQCARQAAALGVDFRTRRLAGSPARGESLEAWAREHRYAALAEMAAESGVSVMLTAHHADDQIETFLLRLARGAGLDGLVGIEVDLTRDGLRLMRPLLALSRRCIEAWARESALSWIEDPSNADERVARNALRRQLMPAIDRVLPSLRHRLPDTLASLREARDRIRALELRDLAGVEVDTREFGLCLSLSAWRALPVARRPGVLRRWLAECGVRMPSRARLAEIARQLESPRKDAQAAMSHDGCVVRRYRDLVILAPAAAGFAPGGRAPEGVPAAGTVPLGAAREARSVPIDWAGEGRIDCPGLGGWLLIEPVLEPGRPGLGADDLRAPDLVLRPRTGGERLRTRPGGPHRSLKNLFQEQGVPPWLRPCLPILWSRGHPVWVPRLGIDADRVATQGERYRLEWIILDKIIKNK
ncbi:tRNA lysidine(34) synthetase TilS [Zeimonas arvi]|uniref:tRNA(Ile)-lysidine synthase n=1 Tax=Zeimonas arvi TaxID=2498847 RepID=A0A5C8P019_9BURK|nr:tRNA lysidine(34) synthetase TilS [Zeimonas arvi]TXL66915.1 tRNA lysidine(34) synthetase TilS [Zeimonas arvi]